MLQLKNAYYKHFRFLCLLYSSANPYGANYYGGVIYTERKLVSLSFFVPPIPIIMLQNASFSYNFKFSVPWLNYTTFKLNLLLRVREYILTSNKLLDLACKIKPEFSKQWDHFHFRHRRHLHQLRPDNAIVFIIPAVSMRRLYCLLHF